MSSTMTIDAANDLVQKINLASKDLGYMPFNNITVIQGKNSESASVSGVCPLCGKTTEFSSEEDGKKACEIRTIRNPNTEEEIKINSCEFCSTSRNEQLNSDPKRELNGLVFTRVAQILEDKFGAKLISTKSNLFNDPEELVTFKKDGNKYKAKLKIIMLYSDITFEDIDPTYLGDGEDGVFTYWDEDFNAIDKSNGEVHNIEEFLLHPERDGVETTTREDEVEEASTEETVEETESSDEVVESDEVEITEESVETVETETEDVDTEVGTTENETTCDPDDVEVETETTEETVEETESSDEVVESDEVEITEESIDEAVETECEFTGTSEEIEISKPEPVETVTKEEVSEEDEEITIEGDSESSSNNFFSDFFKSFNRETTKKEKTESSVSSTTTDDDSDEITIEADGTTSPFSEASEVTQQASEDTKASPITSEARSANVEETDDDVEIESVSDASESDDEEITIEADRKEQKTSKTNQKNDSREEIGSNHSDAIGDEARQVYENDKKWYNNPVYFGDDNNENFNELMDEVDLINEFKESEMFRVISEVVKRTNVQAQYTINEDTFEIPVVDFESGVRVICVDCNKVAQMKVNLALMERQVSFSYDLSKKEGYRKVYFYSDSLSSKERTKATIKNLIKIVNRDRFDGRRIITLGGNYTLFYTDSIPVIRSFEDENSSYPQGKPCTKEIGIIALRHKSGKHEQFTAKDFMNYLNKNYKMDMKNHNLYMVATARYIVKPEANRKTVKYLITDYCELADSILKDGLDHIIGAIMKEHNLNNTVKDPRYLGENFAEYKAEFEFEFDSSALPSPSLEIWSDNGGLFRFPDSFEDGQGKCYIRMPEYRANQTDGFRKDPRLFLPLPFSKLFRADIEKAGVNVLNDNARRKFIEQLGFVESYYPRMKRFILNPVKVMNVQFSSSVLTMSKVDLNKFFSGNGVYDGGYDNILFQKFINSSNLDEKTKNMMSYMALSKMLKS